MSKTGRVFIYWDNSNVFIGARAAAGVEESPGARRWVRIHFANMLRLTHADRPVAKAVVAGAVPPELAAVWAQMQASGTEVRLLDIGGALQGQHQVAPELHLEMLRDAIDNSADPGTMVLVTGDGLGLFNDLDYHAALERLHSKGWRVEALSWRDTCNQRMKRWVEENGIFIALDEHYMAVTAMNPPPGEEAGPGRPAEALDLSKRPMAKTGEKAA